VIRRLGYFLLAELGFWALVTGVVYLFWNEEKGGPFLDEAAPFLLAAFGLCMIPSLVTLVWATWSATRSPEQQLAAGLGGAGVRMFGVLAAGLALTLTIPYFKSHQQGFWFAVLAFYLYSLTLEIVILLWGRI